MESALTQMGPPNTIPAEVSTIERELRRQWRAHAASQPVARTRTLNLVVVSSPDAAPAELVGRITKAHPCRALLIDMVAGAPELHAEVCSSCTGAAPAGPTCIVGEEVRLRVPPEVESGKLESIVVPLLVPDLPVFLWWRGRPDLEHALFTRLVAHADHLVLDSAEYEDPWQGLAAIGSALAARRWRAAVTDLAWSRITAWRELTAQFFDNRQCAEYLAHIRSASIAYMHDGGLPAEAVLLAAWIARQLGWRPGAQAPGPTRIERLAFQRNGDRCAIEFAPHRAAGRGPHSVRLTAAGDQAAAFAIEQTADRGGLTTTTRLGTQPPIQRTVRSRAPDLAETIGRELMLVGRDTLYEQVVSVVEEILRVTQ